MPLNENIVNVGTVPGDRTGDAGQVPFQKYNRAITELYNEVEALQSAQPAVFVQATPATAWVVNHYLNRYPAVMVLNAEMQEVVGDVTYPSLNQLILTFSIAITGQAVLT